MYRMKFLCSVLLASLALGSCSDQPQLIGESDDIFLASVTSVQESLPETDRADFSTALKGFEFLYGENALSVLADSTRIKERVRTRLSGMNGQEVLELWIERRDRAIRQLMDKKAVNEEALEKMKPVEIERSRFRINRAGQRIVELKVKNNTEFDIAHIYFRGILTSRGRRAPWVDDTFHYPFELKPEESAELKFALLGAVWQDVPEGRRNLKLEVTVIRIDSGHETPIYDAYTNPFTKHDLERLETLTEFKKATSTESDID